MKMKKTTKIIIGIFVILLVISAILTIFVLVKKEIQRQKDMQGQEALDRATNCDSDSCQTAEQNLSDSGKQLLLMNGDS